MTIYFPSQTCTTTVQNPSSNFAILEKFSTYLEIQQVKEVLQRGEIATIEESQLITAFVSFKLTSLSEFPDEVNEVFELLNYILNFEGFDVKDFELITNQLLCCYISSISYQKPVTSQTLLKNLLETFKKILSGPSGPHIKTTKRYIYQALPLTANHPAFSYVEQKDIYRLLQTNKDFESKFKTMILFLNLEFISAALKNEIISSLFALLDNKNTPLNIREHIAANLQVPRLFAKVDCIDEDLRVKVAVKLLDMMRENDEPLTLRENAAKSLCVAAWDNKPHTKTLSLEQSIIIPSLMVYFDKPDHPLTNTIAKNLFRYVGGHWHTEQDNPAQTILIESICSLLRNERLPLETKTLLAHCMPKNTEYVLIDTPQALSLFFFMIELLETPIHPLSLQKIYLDHVLSFYRHSKTIEEISRIQPQYKSIDSINEVIRHNDGLRAYFRGSRL